MSAESTKLEIRNPKQAGNTKRREVETKALRAKIVTAAGLLLTTGLGPGCMIPCTVQVPSVHGRVLDAERRTPVTGASVVLAGHPETATVTADDGRFETPAERHWHIFSLPGGDRVDRYDLHVTAPQYDASTRPFSVFRKSLVDFGDVMLTNSNTHAFIAP